MLSTAVLNLPNAAATLQFSLSWGGDPQPQDYFVIINFITSLWYLL